MERQKCEQRLNHGIITPWGSFYPLFKRRRTAVKSPSWSSGLQPAIPSCCLLQCLCWLRSSPWCRSMASPRPSDSGSSRSLTTTEIPQPSLWEMCGLRDRGLNERNNNWNSVHRHSITKLIHLVPLTALIKSKQKLHIQKKTLSLPTTMQLRHNEDSSFS